MVAVGVHDLRRWATDRHRTVDDVPYGGGAGMVLKPEPFFAAVEELYGSVADRPRTVLLTPRGRPLDQALAEELSREPALLLLCGRYEGIDERVHEHLATDELSVGDYVLAGGEVAACVVIEAVTRLLPGVMGNATSVAADSFSAAQAGADACWSTRTTPVPPSSAAGPSPRCCCPATTAQSPAGASEQAVRVTRRAPP